MINLDILNLTLMYWQNAACVNLVYTCGILPIQIYYIESGGLYRVLL